MKKLILFCLLLVCSSQFYAQEAVGSKVVKEKKKFDKEVNEKSMTATQKKQKLTQEAKVKKVVAEKKKADFTNDAKKETKAKKEAGVKLVDSKVAVVRKDGLVKEKKVKEKIAITKDKATGTYNGKKVYTGPKGGKYYINKNGNKTYIDK